MHRHSHRASQPDAEKGNKVGRVVGALDHNGVACSVAFRATTAVVSTIDATIDATNIATNAAIAQLQRQRLRLAQQLRIGQQRAATFKRSAMPVRETGLRQRVGQFHGRLLESGSINMEQWDYKIFTRKLTPNGYPRVGPTAKREFGQRGNRTQMWN
jgi:hypothetical protein